jgi:predicted kinase
MTLCVLAIVDEVIDRKAQRRLMARRVFRDSGYRVVGIGCTADKKAPQH